MGSPDEIILPKRFEAARSDLQFSCSWAVFPEGGGSSICYCTDEARATLVAKALTEMAERQKSSCHLDQTNVAVFSSTIPSFMGLDSPPKAKVSNGVPKVTGFEKDAFISTYAHAGLESELGFDIISLIDGELKNVPEQPIVVIADGKRIDAVALIAKRPDDYGLPKKPRYLLYAVLKDDVEKTKERIVLHACQ